MKRKQTKKEPNRLLVIFMAAEADPFIKVGGLGDVAGSLPVYLRQIDCIDGEKAAFDIRLIIPYHSGISGKYKKEKPVAEFWISKNKSRAKATVYRTVIHNLTVYLIDGKVISSTKSVYSRDPKIDGKKFTFFSLACLHLIERLGLKPDILHANDWHTALTLHLHAIAVTNTSEGKKTGRVLSLHNLPFMGAGSEEGMNEYLVPPSLSPDLPEWARTIPLPMGLSAADIIVAVSPNYAREIQTKEFGCGLQGYLKKNKSKLHGIINGLDYDVWNPEKDIHLRQKYSWESLELRSENKNSLQAEFNLPCNESVPLFILISRMDLQKGIDLAMESIREIGSQDWQAIFLGSGDPDLEHKVLALQKEYPMQFRAAIRFDSSLSHRMYAGGDMLLMPSRYEPCGLSQLISLRYGCIPIARSTGGLADTIQTNAKSGRTGYLFKEAKVEDMVLMIKKALRDYGNKMKWLEIQKRGMKMDFSWNNSAIEYARLYLSLKNKR